MVRTDNRFCSRIQNCDLAGPRMSEVRWVFRRGRLKSHPMVTSAMQVGLLGRAELD